MASGRRHAAVEVEARCAPLLRRLDRAASRFVGRPADTRNPRRVLSRCVATFGVLLDRLWWSCAHTASRPPASPWRHLALEGKLRLLRITYRLSCGLHDEVVSIAAAQERQRSRGGSVPALRLAWVRPVLAVRGDGAQAVALSGDVVYAEWQRCGRTLEADEPLMLSAWEMRDIARTLCAAGDELRAQAVCVVAGLPPSDSLPGAVCLAPALRPAAYVRFPARVTPRTVIPLRPRTASRSDAVRVRTVLSKRALRGCSRGRTAG